jgi:hypothetical protein
MVTAAAALCSVLLAGGSAATSAGAAATARAAAPAATWGTAAEIPGSNRLNKGGQDGIGSVSCATSTVCSAGGSYTTAFVAGVPTVQAFVVNKTGGTWRKAEEVPGTATLNAGGRARTTSLSCSAAGNCSAGGYYTDASGRQQAFVVSEAAGTWGTAAEVPGTAALNQGNPGAAIGSLSCSSVGNCSAGGYYADASGRQQAFVVSETGGTWGTAAEVPGTAALNAGGHAATSSVSCAAGGCSAGGYYASSTTDGIPVTQAFVVSETGGSWGTAAEVPGTAALNGGGYAVISSVSCATAGNCSAGGEYTDSTPATEAFVVSETGGSWGTAAEVPGIAALNQRRLAQVNSVSCPTAGNCVAGGFYQDAAFISQAFIVSETGGSWGTAAEVPGTAALDKGSSGAVTISVSCAAAGNCSAGGYYTDASDFEQAFVVSETGGSWGTAAEVPGTAVLNAGGQAATQSVSCPPAGNCSAGGQYKNANSATEVFVVNETGS